MKAFVRNLASHRIAACEYAYDLQDQFHLSIESGTAMAVPLSPGEAALFSAQAMVSEDDYGRLEGARLISVIRTFERMESAEAEISSFPRKVEESDDW